MDESQCNYAELKKSDLPPAEKKNNCVILFIQKHETLENANQCIVTEKPDQWLPHGEGES